MDVRKMSLNSNDIDNQTYSSISPTLRCVLTCMNEPNELNACSGTHESERGSFLRCVVLCSFFWVCSSVHLFLMLCSFCLCHSCCVRGCRVGALAQSKKSFLVLSFFSFLCLPTSLLFQVSPITVMSFIHNFMSGHC